MRKERPSRHITELTLLNELALAIGRARDVDTIVRTLVRRSLGALGAEQGVITLLDDAADAPAVTLVRTAASGASTATFRPDEALLAWMYANRRPLVIDDVRKHAVFHEFDWDGAVESVLCVPLEAHGRLQGVITLYNKTNGDRFSDEDARLLTIIAGQSAQIVEAARADEARQRAQEERDRIRNVFGRHTAPAVVEELLRHDTEPPSRRVYACIMFLDLRGFTTYSEHAEPEEVVDYLNALFGFMIEAVSEAKGILHNFLGDGFMAIFGAPVSHGNDCRSAIEASLDILAQLDERIDSGELPPTRLGIGLHAGEVVAGTIGSHVHKEYQVTGDVVNTAARIEQLNKTYGSRLLVSGEVWVKSALHPGDPRIHLHEHGDVEIRGRTEPLHLVELA
ncbi:MAG: adenylate/guanylate cyclase domain-containing protein [Rhodothermales bacterium]